MNDLRPTELTIEEAAYRNRLQAAVRGVTVSPELEFRIRQSMRPAAESQRRPLFWAGALALAATLLICVSVAIAYRSGYLRMTVASQEAYIRSISQQVSGIMQVGLGDHVHCAVFRKFPKNPPSLETMTEKLGPQYKDLIAIVQQSVPSDYRVILAHRCSYHSRKFVHLTFTNGSQLASLVIADKGSGESFDKDTLIPAMSQSGIPMYQAGIQRFELTAFETHSHLVYLVSDLGATKNGQMMVALADAVRTVLHKIES